MKKRVFVSICFSKKLKSKILSWQKRQDLPVHWITEKNLHLTLVPPWYIENQEKLIKKLKSLKEVLPFYVDFNEIKFGPSPKKPRLIWAEGETPPELFTLRQKLYQKLKKIPEGRRFKTHFTIARFNPKQFSVFPIKKLSEKVHWKDKINYFYLMESRLKRTGADYQVLEKIKL